MNMIFEIKYLLKATKMPLPVVVIDAILATLFVGRNARFRHYRIPEALRDTRDICHIRLHIWRTFKQNGNYLTHYYYYSEST